MPTGETLRTVPVRGQPPSTRMTSFIEAPPPPVAYCSGAWLSSRSHHAILLS